MHATKLPPSIVRLVSCTLLGSGVLGCAETLDPDGLAKLLAQAEQGDATAAHELCFRNIYGRGIPRDYRSALRWCDRGARAGIPDSQTLLAEIYYYGHGVPADYRIALALYTAAAEQGHSHAQYMIYLMHSRGEASGIDETKATEWLQRAAAGGSEDAQRALKAKD